MPGPLSPEPVVACIEAVVDPFERAALAHATYKVLRMALFRVRDAALAECRPYGSITEVARRVRLSRSRVHQITAPATICTPAPVPPPVPGPSEPARHRKTAGAGDVQTLADREAPSCP